VTTTADDDKRFMARALGLATQGEGFVEPNPQVGCVIVHNGQIVGEGFHARFGGPHAEVIALNQAGEAARGGTLYVTLEPCCHLGKTPPCTKALIQAGVARAVIAAQDPFPQVNGRGIRELEAAGVACEIGILGDEGMRLIAPYRKLVTAARPWVIAKWAMTLDGKLATRTGDSRWISSEASRQIVHQLRGRVDAVMVGSGTARADDPLLTARPADVADIKRVAMRVVVDQGATLSVASKLVQTAGDVPVMVFVGPAAAKGNCEKLAAAGVEIVRGEGGDHAARLESLLRELGRRGITNVLVEGGGRLLGALIDMRAIDEVHVFVAPKIVGGESAPRAIGGGGIERMADALALGDITIEELDGDVYVHGRVAGKG
jgi:diaminohydroxyphosphoribosylaminopyrimidine deaminase/5-amino-6-(5-phosphoribosylamino)uracil reductase